MTLKSPDRRWRGISVWAGARQGAGTGDSWRFLFGSVVCSLWRGAFLSVHVCVSTMCVCVCCVSRDLVPWCRLSPLPHRQCGACAVAGAGHRPRARTQVRVAEPSGLRPSRTRPRGNGRWRRRSRGFAGRRRAPPWGRVRPSWRWRPNAFELGMFSERCTYLQCRSALNLCYELCAQSQGRGRLPGLPGKAAGPGFRSEVP